MTKKPSEAEAWEWDEGNEEELHRHSITARDIYEVWANGPTWVPNVRHRAGDWKMLGQTNGGRRLTIVVRLYSDRNVLRPITGWDSTAGERSRYFEGS
jgi:uncharacterized DUF497 family protein